MLKYLKITLIALLASISAGAQINTDRVMDIGRNALYFEDYVLSIQYFNQVISAKPYLAAPYFFRGLAKFNLDDFTGAEADLTRSIDHNPFMTAPYQVRGLSLIRLGRTGEAAADYRRALKIDPENTSLWHNLALCSMKLKNYEEARHQLDTLITVSPRYTAGYLMRSEVGLLENDTLSAEEDIRRAMEADKYDPAVWSSLARLSILRENYPEAESQLDNAIRYSVKDASPYINRALVRIHRNNLRGAMSDYDTGLGIDPRNFLGHYNRGLLRARVGDYNRAVDDFDYVIKADPSDMMATFNRALLLDHLGDNNGAIRDYTTVINRHPNFITGYDHRAKVYRRIGQTKKAAADETKVLEAQLERFSGVKKKKKDNKTRRRSDQDMANYNKIVIADEGDDGTIYKTDYRGRVQNRNVKVRPRPLFAMTYYERRGEIAGQIHYNKLIDKINNSKQLPQRLIVTNNEASLDEARIERHFKSVDEISARIAATPDDYMAWMARAMDFYLSRDFTSALADLDMVVKLAPDFFPGYFMRSLIRSRQLEYIGSGTSVEYDNIGARDKIGIKALDYEGVRHDLDMVIKLAPDFAPAYYNRASLEVLLKDYRAAIADYDRCIEIDPKFADAYFNRGITCIYTDEAEQGVRDLSKAGELGLYEAYNIIKRYSK